MSVQVERELVRDYFRLFVNRRAYTVQSMRPHPQSGRFYYYRPTAKSTGQPLSMTYETLQRHLEGRVTIALYAINPSNQCSKWVAIDADYKDALEDLLKLNYSLAGTTCTERSRRAVAAAICGCFLRRRNQRAVAGFMSTISRCAWECR